MLPEEEAAKLGTIIPPESWSEITESRKGGGDMFRSIFINVFFTDEKQYHVKPMFIRKEFTNDELSRLIKDSIKLPFEKRYLENNPKAMGAMIKTIQGLSKMLKEKINAAVLQHVKKYWSNNNKNCLRTETYVVNTFGETVWNDIKANMTLYMSENM